jgi:hypothetical protein
MGATLDELKARHPAAETYRLGDSALLSDELLALVQAGRKRATCTAEAEIGVSEVLPEVGRCDIVLDFDGVPQLVTLRAGAGAGAGAVLRHHRGDGADGRRGRDVGLVARRS